ASAIYILNAINLIAVLKLKTKNFKTLLFFTSGIFILGAASFAGIIGKTVIKYPSGGVFLSYLYAAGGLCFAACAITFIIVNIKNLNYAQTALDLTVTMFLTAATAAILFFRLSIFGASFSAPDIARFLYLALSAGGISLIIYMLISSRAKNIGLFSIVILLCAVLFFFSNAVYASGVAANTGLISKFVGWLCVLCPTVITVFIKISFLKNICLNLFLNESRIKYAWLIFLPLVIALLTGEIKIADILIFSTVSVSYLILSLYIQINAANKKLLKSKTAYDELLNTQEEDRTYQLESALKNFKYLIHHDSLTGLLSRQRFFDMIDKQIKKRNNEKSLYLIILDINKFRFINQIYGFKIGDKILKQISELITDNFYSNSYIARTDSDEFSILCYDTDFEEINNKLSRIYLLLHNSIKAESYQLSISIRTGIAKYPKNASDRINLIKCAKASLAHAKKLNFSDYCLYNDEIQSKINRNAEIELALKKADIESEFSLNYQPIYDISGTKIAGVEALLRWNSPVLGQVSPKEFISIAEETGIILPLGQWVLSSAMKHIKELNSKHNCELFMGINISTIQLKNTNFIDKVCELIIENNIMPSWINFEITENLKITEQDEKTLTQITSMGINLSVDNFGTGYFSYNNFNKFSFDFIKINKSLIDNITSRQKDALTVKSIIAMAKILNIKVLASGVENNQQMELLSEMGCDYIQGYIYAKPVTLENLITNYLGH
ncbi:MAG: EAL domain-containing protein, partial [Eubacteriaceae bacterium]|nr:EAL domain-containing protein [Eubacteriaceae bacterium]